MKMFNKEDLKFFLPKEFKGLSKQYLLNCIFNEVIQSKWNPSVGDIIVGKTGNIFVISVVDTLHEALGGTRYYFGGGSCNRDGGHFLDSTFYYTANESGIYYHPSKGKIENLNHSSIRDFRYVPYPHELKNYNASSCLQENKNSEINKNITRLKIFFLKNGNKRKN